MKCPSCKTELQKTILKNVEIDFCPICLGIFFENEELRLAKDETDKDLNWFDIDLWKDKKKLKISKRNALCPFCELPLYMVEYGDSGIRVDICNVCFGIWLDRKEFKEIIGYTKEKADYEILHNYLKNLLQEGVEIISGPETFKEEILDFLTILKLFKYKLLVQYPELTRIISQLPR